MQKRRMGNYIAASTVLCLFLLLVVLLRCVDVEPIGPMGGMVGLATVNKAFFEMVGSSAVWDSVTEAFLLLSLAVALVFASVGAYQWIRRRSLRLVDARIKALGVVYVLLLFFYLFFEFIIINCRPVLVNRGAEASFPSSHVMIVVSVMGTAALYLWDTFASRVMGKVGACACALVALLVVIGRALSGMHWLTDVLGGVLLALFLLFLYRILLSRTKK